MDEKNLIKSALKGDATSFALLFHENYPFLVKYLVKISLNIDLAEEIAQETMAKCMEKLHLFNGKSKFSSWLITIATNVYFDYLRKEKREKNWQLQEQAFRKIKWQFESRNEEWNDVLSALGKLSEEVRIPIILKHYYGYSYEDIGHMMKLSAGTIKSRVHNGILAVRKELKLDEEVKNHSLENRSTN
ncbi:RNA polymerase sigma factor SigY [Pseudoneobacillus sp. C159]